MEYLAVIATIITSVLSSGVLATYISQRSARKNLKTSQYVNVVTAERIRWIENFRLDFSLLLSSVLFYINNQENLISENGGYNRTNDEYELSSRIKDEYKYILGRSAIVEKSIILKLKLNPNQDVEIIQYLDEIINTFSDMSKEVASADVDYNDLVRKCQDMFKIEWEKVKTETEYK
ncbi:hypothetical protein [Bacteroides sp.]|uniref:hypothetical protein n=1 Tax=Bacteroides sp. TaxID=29523 RepID=UPI003D0C5690